MMVLLFSRPIRRSTMCNVCHTHSLILFETLSCCSYSVPRKRVLPLQNKYSQPAVDALTRSETISRRAVGSVEGAAAGLQARLGQLRACHDLQQRHCLCCCRRRSRQVSALDVAARFFEDCRVRAARQQQSRHNFGRWSDSRSSKRLADGRRRLQHQAFPTSRREPERVAWRSASCCFPSIISRSSCFCCCCR